MVKVVAMVAEAAEEAVVNPKVVVTLIQMVLEVVSKTAENKVKHKNKI